VTMRAQGVRAQDSDRSDGGQYWLASQPTVVSLLTAATGDAAVFGGRGGELQQLTEGGTSSLMHGRTHGDLDGFQIETSRLASFRKDDAQQSIYFAADFLLDSFERFFSCALSDSVTGRVRQIFSFTSTKVRPS
jgi:hypothetical protein